MPIGNIGNVEEENIGNVEVVNFYQIGKKIPEDGMYIGRYNYNFELQGSKFANPFPVKSPEERGTTIEKYRQWLWKEVMDKKITKDDILALKNKKLVCYCKPKACHGDVVKSLVNYVLSNEEEFDNKVNSNTVKKIKP